MPASGKVDRSDVSAVSTSRGALQLSGIRQGASEVAVDLRRGLDGGAARRGTHADRVAGTAQPAQHAAEWRVSRSTKYAPESHLAIEFPKAGVV
jgi:hypothetical protein